MRTLRKVLLLFCLLPAFVRAQDSTFNKTDSTFVDIIDTDSLETDTAFSKQQKPLSFGYFAAGAGKIDLTDLNQVLENEGLTKVDPSFMNIGLGAFTTKGRTIIGAEGHYYATQQKYLNGAIRARMDGFCGSVDLGYILSDNRVVLFYPMLGIGFGGLNLNLDSTNSKRFSQYLTQPNVSANLRMRNYLLDANLNLLFKIPDSPFDYLGFRAGYRYCHNEWMNNSQAIEEAPKSGLNGTYFEVYIGFNNVKK